MTDALYYTTHASPIGNLLIVASPRGVRYLTLLNEGEDVKSVFARLFAANPPATPPMELRGFFASACEAIDDYLNNDMELDLPYDLVGGTPLQRSVWLALTQIPYGQTISYSTLAERVGFPRAVRAVASACGDNPIPLIIPCHRVVAKDGGLGGFSLGGVGVKQKLLAIESQDKVAFAAA